MYHLSLANSTSHSLYEGNQQNNSLLGVCLNRFPNESYDTLDIFTIVDKGVSKNVQGVH